MSEIKRCAIYTRKSTEEGLDQAFNSLDAQREACEAYITSQRHEGWRLVKTRYDDGGLSGGNMERPALQALLAELDAGRIDIIVVYKVDRLTRSLADFAKLVERFDAQDASFVSVTQAFNTSNSMGRLTLNVLLSFAQFEREVTAERIRDKITASKRKGLWTGGVPPLGYDNVDKKLVINKQEAKTVRRLFAVYLETGSGRAVLEIAKAENLTARPKQPGGAGRQLTRGPLYYILCNPIYAGYVRCKAELCEGEHDHIIDRSTWNQVQIKRNEAAQRAGKSLVFRQPLAGKLFANGERMTPTHARKGSKRYRYYVTKATETGAAASQGRWRTPADALEAAILNAIDHWLASPEAPSAILCERVSASALNRVYTKLESIVGAERKLSPRERLSIWAERITRIELSEAQLTIRFDPQKLITDAGDLPLAESITNTTAAVIGPRGQGLRLMIGEFENAEPNESLRQLIGDAFIWRDKWFNDPTRSLAEIARDANLDVGEVSRAIRLSFLAPDIVLAILNGTASTSLTAKQLRRLNDLPPSWAAQRRLIKIEPN
ncbi:MAG: recombinase family protein [Parvularculaceae bacterium]